MFTDTGYYARHILHYDYDEAHDGSGHMNEGTGGIRSDGPHLEMQQLIDGAIGVVMLQAPRGSYKSTWLESFCCRNICANPNVRILYGMKTDKKAKKEKLKAVRDQLENNETLIAHFGQQKGPMWSEDGLVVCTRTDTGISEPTMSTFGVDKTATGGHYEIIILDDLVDWSNVDTKEGIDKVRRAYMQVIPLLVPGGILIVVGTRYDDSDLYGDLESKGIKLLILDSGDDLEVVEDDLGRMRVKGTPRFAHETVESLQGKLDNMDYASFMAQYMNQIVTGIREEFRREYFRPCRFTHELSEELTCWLFTDTAVTDSSENCMSVLAYVGLNELRYRYLLDLRCGYWAPDRFVDEYFDVLLNWQNKVHHGGELMEVNAANYVYRSLLKQKAADIGMRINPKEINRGGGEPAKKKRIRASQPPMAQGKFHVCNTVPKHYLAVSDLKVLWDPEGFTDPKSGVKLPSGELVDQFIRHPKHPKNDIADALADVDRTEKGGSYYAGWTPPNRRRRTRKATVRGEVVRLHPFNKLPVEQPKHVATSFWDGLKGR